ncbi:MAG TPA: hypothetical protein PK251_14715 [Candidatus Latescibacteria bacterium]|nr:hypothetical protein [Candidatus Latescibacterota bacterium]HOS65991.1 hypothetical protein [Candidatus Latescibacterota bacterium]
MKMRFSSRLALVVFGLTSAAFGALEPDFYVDMLTSDGAGKIDPDYFYHSGSYPKTAKVQFDYHSWNYCREPGDTTIGRQRGLLGFWDTNKGGASGVRAAGTSEMVFWHGSTSAKNSSVTGTSNGRARIEFDYLNTTASWSSSSTTKPIADVLRLPSNVVTVPYHLCHLENCSYYSYLGIYAFRVFEQMSEGAEPVVVREYRPACVNGRPALYDPYTMTAAYPTTDGFTIPMTNVITVATGKTLHVSRHSATQRSVTLETGSELVFDGLTTLKPTEGVTLPAGGVVTVSLPVSTGVGTYVLIDGLDSGFVLSGFVLGNLPTGLDGTLEKQGSQLVLKVFESIPHPDAIGTKLTSDAHGYIDTEYLFKSTTLPKTARVVLSFSDWNSGKSPASTSVGHGVFGFWCGLDRSGARWYGADSQRFGSGNTGWSASHTTTYGAQSIVVDYKTGEISWNGHTNDLGISSSDSTCRYYLFNLFNGTGKFQEESSLFDFQSMQVYETSDNFATETLARDFVPCINGGKAGIYDRVTGAVYHPTGDTNGFVTTETLWRVGTKGDVGYVAAGTAQSFATGGDGYLVLRRAGGGVFASGSGATASFVMPTSAVEVVSTVDKTVAASAVETINERLCVHGLSLGAGSELAFGPEGVVYVSGTVSPPTDGVVRLSLNEISGAGVYTLLRGISGDFDLTKFTVGTVTSGFTATLECWGDALVVRVVDDLGGAPRFVRSILSDGDGWIDTGYTYRGATYPKTARVRFDFYNYNYGRKPEATTGFTAQFGFWGNKAASSLYRSNGSDLTLWYSNGSSQSYKAYAGFPKSGQMVLEIGYRTGLATLTIGGVPTTVMADMPVSPNDFTSQSYYVCGCNGNNSTSYSRIHAFSIWEYDNMGQEALAVDYVPCVSAGKAALYDRVRKIVTFPTYKEGNQGAGFTVSDWGVITQRFVQVTLVSTEPVTTPAFAPQGAYMFTADGTVTPARSLESLTLIERAADGTEVGRSVVTRPAVGKAYDVTLGTAALVDVIAEDAADNVNEQDFGPVVVSCTSEALYRTVDQKTYELMVSGDATLTFAEKSGSVTATFYDANGEVLGTQELVARIAAETPLAVTLNGARYAVLEVCASKKGFVMTVR